MAHTHTKREIEIYVEQKNKAHFDSPQKETEWALTQKKICSKCGENKVLTEYNGNTSGTDAFDRQGYRLRRPECKECTKKAQQGKNKAMTIAKIEGIPYKAPEGTKCAFCDKLTSKL